MMTFVQPLLGLRPLTGSLLESCVFQVVVIGIASCKSTVVRQDNIVGSTSTAVAEHVLAVRGNISA